MEVLRYDHAIGGYVTVSQMSALVSFDEAPLFVQLDERLRDLPRDGSRFLMFSPEEESMMIGFMNQVMGDSFPREKGKHRTALVAQLLDYLLRPSGWVTTLIPTDGDGATPSEDLEAFSLGLAALSVPAKLP